MAPINFGTVFISIEEENGALDSGERESGPGAKELLSF